MTLIQDHVEADAFHKEFLTGGMCRVTLICKECLDLSGNTAGWHRVGVIATSWGWVERSCQGERGRRREGERGRVS